jgi:hypothetical protein
MRGEVPTSPSVPPWSVGATSEERRRGADAFLLPLMQDRSK